MASLRLRYPFAGAFAALVLISAYIGLGPNTTIPAVNDKALHFVAFFLLTLTLYWSIDLPRRILLRYILIGMAALSVGSEAAQGILPNDRTFDPIDIAFNLAGVAAALGICNWYHKRMMERKRRRKYGAVSTGDGEGVELGNAEEYTRDEQELGILEDDDGEAWDEMDPVPEPEVVDGTAKT